MSDARLDHIEQRLVRIEDKLDVALENKTAIRYLTLAMSGVWVAITSIVAGFITFIVNSK